MQSENKVSYTLRLGNGPCIRYSALSLRGYCALKKLRHGIFKTVKE